jgi:DNA transposition AAA+ family ATPase
MSTVREVAEEVGVSAATVSLVQNGRYRGSTQTKEKVMARLKRTDAPGEGAPEGVEPDIMESIRPAQYTPPLAGFTTLGQQIMYALLQASLDEAEFSLITAPSGVGKTTVGVDFCDQNGGSYFKCRRSMGLGSMLDALCEHFHLSIAGTNDRKLGRLARLPEMGVPILIVDEADLLTSKRGDAFLQMIEVFRELKESGLPVVLMGLPDLELQIRAQAASYIYSRLGYYANVQAPTSEELIRFAEMLQIGEKYRRRVIVNASHRGFFRYVAQVSKRAVVVGDEAALGLVYVGRESK